MGGKDMISDLWGFIVGDSGAAPLSTGVFWPPVWRGTELTNEVQIDRRGFFSGVAVAAGGLAAASAGAVTPADRWDHETDILCVGGGSAGCSAAVAAVDAGARTMLVEKNPLIGGTTAKSGGVAWIPNNFILRQQGIDDDRLHCLRYMARYAYPQIYDPESPTLGLAEAEHALLAAFFDNASVMIDRLQEIGVAKFQQFRLFNADVLSRDYADYLPENKVPAGRAIELAGETSPAAGGYNLIARMEAWLNAKKVPILTDTPVTGLVMHDGRVVGATAERDGKPIRIAVRRGVIFASGGYAHNVELVQRHQIAIWGSCALTGSTGDFIRIAESVGAAMGSMHTAWRTQVPLEEALTSRAVSRGLGGLAGDSMIVVNKYGDRVMNEKGPYNERGVAHFHYDAIRAEYPNQLLFMLFDERSLDCYGGSHPIPVNASDVAYVIKGATIEELTAGIAERLATHGARIGRVTLAPDFASKAKQTIKRFNGFAETGKDADFLRGLHEYDREWQLFSTVRRKEARHPPSTMPNNTMHPIADKGPYYAIILAAGALDTNGGPLIDAQARVLDSQGKPIPGLYGAGNCIASPLREGYFGPGATIGPAMAFGYIAAHNAAKGA